MNILLREYICKTNLLQLDLTRVMLLQLIKMALLKQFKPIDGLPESKGSHLISYIQEQLVKQTDILQSKK